MKKQSLTSLESEVLRKLSCGSHPVLVALRQQAEACFVAKRTHTGVGFYCELIVPDGITSAAIKARRIGFGDVIGKTEHLELGVGFVVFIEHGRLTMLEAYTFGEPWPKGHFTLQLSYGSEPRDLSQLAS